MNKINCNKCRYCDAVNMGETIGEIQLICRYNPPQLLVIPGGSPIAGGQVQLQIRPFHPPVAPNDWCGQGKIEEISHE